MITADLIRILRTADKNTSEYRAAYQNAAAAAEALKIIQGIYSTLQNNLHVEIKPCNYLHIQIENVLSKVKLRDV